ncbi:hypothetical protein [Pseudoalteromonas denitrificans]|uniref:Uncharacterized protein n=1 Tax=Pseudoalteromonas denitrificans DSM 6059 TaxID=1123010 RepID=A0A1I1FYA5_9GAMM|nr:hypothetical protein [Pseudoalteromonas denitrificans]SFC04447.1 hypothetical protein SAMN02745724_00743 [Pseudoalteromonas denitrificans DSM 6059]
MRKLKFDGFSAFIFIICIINLVLTVAVLFLPEESATTERMKVPHQGNDSRSVSLPEPNY